jgi:DNA invertase Pin-like site-specific DNA recombinase
MTTVGYARVSSTGQDLGVQLEKLEAAGCEKVFKEKRSGVDPGRPELKRCLEYVRDGDTLLVAKIDRLARSTADLYRIISQLSEKGVSFKVVDDPTIDTTSRTGKLVMGILALIAESENDIRRERQMDGIAQARDRGVKFGRKPILVPETIKRVRCSGGLAATSLFGMGDLRSGAKLLSLTAKSGSNTYSIALSRGGCSRAGSLGLISKP